jgi:hypothetical protein
MCQAFELLTVGAMIEHEVVGPYLVRTARRLRSLSSGGEPLLRPPARHLQPRRPPQPKIVCSLIACRLATAATGRDPPRAVSAGSAREPAELRGRFPHSLENRPDPACCRKSTLLENCCPPPITMWPPQDFRTSTMVKT